MPAHKTVAEKKLSPFTELSSPESINKLESHSINARRITYILTIVILLIIGYLLTLLPWKADASTHALLEFLASVNALIIGSMCLIKFYTRNKRMYLLIGIGFLGAAFFDWLQALTANIMLSSISSPLVLLHEWSISRGFLSFFLLASWALWYNRAKHPFKIPTVYLLCAIAALNISAFFILYSPDLALLVEIIIIGVFTATAIMYFKKKYWKWKYFEHWLIMSLLVAVAADSARLLSTVPYDQFFIAAHILKIFSYNFAMLGLFMSMYSAFTEVEEARDKIDVILKSIGEGVFVTDIEGNIILMNNAAEQLTGMSSDKAFRKNYTKVFKFYHEADKNKPFVDFVEKILKSGVVRETYSRILLKKDNGISIPVSISTAPVKTHSDKLFGCIVVFHDIRKERELERTKDSFLSVAAHQLRAPLGSMRWNMEMLLSGDLGEINDLMKQSITQLHENNQRMIGLVNDLLDVSKIDSSISADQPKPTNIAAIIRNVVKEMEAEAFTRSIKFDIKPKLIQVSNINIDPNRVHEVFENLVSNAVKYNRNGGTVRIIIQEKPDTLEVSVADNGIGIPHKDQEHLFSKYYRAANARAGAAEGSGLGLFVVKSYVEGWGGTITFKSTEDQGTTFIVSIPKNPKQHTLDVSTTNENRSKQSN